MSKVVVEIPDELVEEFRQHVDHLREVIPFGLQQLKTLEVLTLYSRGLVSIGRAAELSGVSRQELIRQARAAGIAPCWSEQMVTELFSTAKTFGSVKRLCSGSGMDFARGKAKVQC